METKYEEYKRKISDLEERLQQILKMFVDIGAEIKSKKDEAVAEIKKRIIKD